MRRILTTAVASSLLALALPAAASAHHSARHHRRHQHHAHTVVFTAGSVRTMPGTTAPTTSSTPTGTEAAATIVSFENGVLKLTLADGSTVAGKVTERTEIECGAANQQAGDDNDGNDDQGNDQGNDSHVGPGPGSFSQAHGDDEQGGDNQGGNEEGSCGVSALTPGAKVAEADLAVTSAGSFWEKIELA